MRRLSLRAVVLACLLSIAMSAYAMPRQDEPGFGSFLNRIVRIIRRVLPLDTVDPSLPKP
jgi:hypothetical protein